MLRRSLILCRILESRPDLALDFAFWIPEVDLFHPQDRPLAFAHALQGQWPCFSKPKIRSPLRERPRTSLLRLVYL